jgi:hypothetical protein
VPQEHDERLQTEVRVQAVCIIEVDELTVLKLAHNRSDLSERLNRKPQLEI